MGNVKKSVAERTRHKRQYGRRIKERQMQSRESKVVLSKALEASLVVIECSRTKSDEHITSNSSGTYITHVVDADIIPVNDQESSAKVHLTAQHNVLANEQQQTDQSEPSYDTYLLEKMNSHAKVQSPKSRNNIKPVKKIPNINKSERWISKGYRFSPNKSSAVHEKPNTPRSCLRWKPTGRIFKTAGLSSGLALHRQMASADNTSGPAPQRKKGVRFSALYLQKKRNLLVFDHSHLHSSYFPMLIQPLSRSTSGLVPQPPSPTPNLLPTKSDWDTVFYPLFDEYFNPPPRAVSPVPAAVAAPRAVDPASSPSSTIIDQDVP
uniref:Uncharacterized protein n=1 Tax=Tanacetum cinerariifolium TaxID=118510 RepID=A0A6L2JGT9_TANCI|nr:hypothetical protein [Tanacetum cinerariifolium]